MVAEGDDHSDDVDADPEDAAVAEEDVDSWDDPEDAPIEADAEGQSFEQTTEREEVVVGEDGEAFQLPRCLPCPTAPSLAMQAKQPFPLSLCFLVPMVCHGMQSKRTSSRSECLRPINIPSGLGLLLCAKR